MKFLLFLTGDIFYSESDLLEDKEHYLITRL